MLEIIAKSLQGYIKESKKSDQKSNQKSDQKILSLIRQDSTITISTLCDKLSMSESGVKKIIKKLKNEKRLQRRGGLKGGYWEVLMPRVED